MAKLLIETAGRDQQVLNDLGRRIKKRIGANPMGLCPVDMLLNYLRICHAQSCGKCSPCRIGLWHLSQLLKDIRNCEATDETLDLLEKTAEMIRVSADCAIGYEAANMVLEGIDGFRADMEEHIRNGRCLQKIQQSIPCTAVCPAHVDVPGYIALVKSGNYKDAVRLIRKDNPFPSVCGYVCEHPCENRCRRLMVDDAVNICGIKRFAVDNAGDIPVPQCAEPTGKKVAIVGGGPGGLTAAYFLTVMGHDVTVYEQRHRLGGMLRYGIPDYRLPIDVLEMDIQYILDTGVKTVMDSNVGEDISVDELKEQYDAVYLSIGAHDDKKLDIPGAEGKNVMSAVEMLRAIGEGTGEAPDFAGKNICVIGGGNVAMDATRTCLRLGAKRVSCVYRRRIEDMTALPEEVEEAQAEGGIIRTLLAPDSIELDKEGKVTALMSQPQLISLIEKNGRTGVRKADEEPVRIPCDYIIVAIGQSIHYQPFEDSGMMTNRGTFMANAESYVGDNVFAGGDAVSGPATVIRAVAAGKVAANNIDVFLGYHHVISADDIEVPEPQMTNNPPCGRVNLGSKVIDEIEGNFDLVSVGMTTQAAKQECGRCLRCDHFGFGSFRGGRQTQW